MEVATAALEAETRKSPAPERGEAVACGRGVGCRGQRCRALVGLASEPPRADALARLCESSWGTVYRLVRRRGLGHADAEDVTQAYFCRFIEKGWLHDATAWRGCLQPFLYVSVRHFLSNHWNRERALKRGGGRVVSIETRHGGRLAVEPVEGTTPETILARKSMSAALARAFARLAAETQGGPGRLRLARLRPFLHGEADGDSYRQVAADWGVGETAVRVAAHRLRRRLRALLRNESAGRGAGPVPADSLDSAQRGADDRCPTDGTDTILHQGCRSASSRSHDDP
jgi:DNA-directed RNA polymerase specialized sigma24 family protein